MFGVSWVRPLTSRGPILGDTLTGFSSRPARYRAKSLETVRNMLVFLLDCVGKADQQGIVHYGTHIARLSVGATLLPPMRAEIAMRRR